MKVSRRALSAALMLAVVSPLVLAAGKTKILKHWHEEAGPNPYKHVLVLAMARDEGNRLVIEKEIAAKIRKRGAKAEESALLAPHDPSESSDAWRAKIKAAAEKVGADSVLVATLEKEVREDKQVLGATTTIPVLTTPSYGGFGTYFASQYQTVYNEGYVVSDATYFVETSLYDYRTEKPRWVAQSETVNPQEIQTGAEAYADIIVRALRDDGFLP